MVSNKHLVKNSTWVECGKISVLKKLLKYYNRRIELRLVAPNLNEQNNAEPKEFSEAIYDSFEALEEEIES